MKQKLILQSLVMDTDIKSKLRAAESEFLNEQLQNILIQEKDEQILLVLLSNNALTEKNRIKIKDILGITETQEEKSLKILKISDLNQDLKDYHKVSGIHSNEITKLENELSNMESEIKHQILTEHQMKKILENDIEEYNYLFLEDTLIDIKDNNKIINIKDVKPQNKTDKNAIMLLSKEESGLKDKLLERFINI
jgi:hypothetical protein